MTLLIILLLLLLNITIIYLNFKKIKLYFLKLTNFQKILFVCFLLIFNLFSFVIIYYFLLNNEKKMINFLNKINTKLNFKKNNNFLIKIKADEKQIKEEIDLNNEKFDYKLTPLGKNFNSEKEFKDYLIFIFDNLLMPHRLYLKSITVANFKKFSLLFSEKELELLDDFASYDNYSATLSIKELFEFLTLEQKALKLLGDYIKTQTPEETDAIFNYNNLLEKFVNLENQLTDLELECFNNLAELEEYYRLLSLKDNIPFERLIAKYSIEVLQNSSYDNLYEMCSDKAYLINAVIRLINLKKKEEEKLKNLENEKNTIIYLK